MEENDLVPFTIRGPTPTHCCLEGGVSIKKIGSSIIDLHFAQPSQLGELTFANFYSAFISIYIKRYSDGASKSGCGINQRHDVTNIDDVTGEKSIPALSTPQNNKDGLTEDACGRFRRIPSSASGSGRGKCVLLDLESLKYEFSASKRLMICPHFELGSQDHFSIQATESLVEWRDVLVMRLVLHQPSSVWKMFAIEDIKICRHLPRRAFNFDDVARQKDSRLVVLTANTLRMLSGMTVEPEPEKLDK